MNISELKDYYGLLGIPTNSTVSEIHKAYWHKASKCHPDMGGNHEEMVQLVEAWKILSDPDKRARYDQLYKYRHDGWHSTKFNDDVKDAQKRAKDDAARSWSEFEEIYQKAFYRFNQDFYGEEIHEKANGPFSPLMGAVRKDAGGQGTAKSHPQGGVTFREREVMIGYVMKTFIMVAAIMAALLFYRNFSGIGRYVPLGPQDGAYLQMLDTTTGAVYFVEKRGDRLSSSWKETVSPFNREKKSFFK